MQRAFVTRIFGVLTLSMISWAAAQANEPKAIENGVASAVPALSIAGNTEPDARTLAAPPISAKAVREWRAPDGTAFMVVRFANRTGVPLRVEFGGMRLASGAVLFVYGIGNTGAAHNLQRVTGTGPLHTGRFISSPIAGDTIILEYQRGASSAGDLPFQVEGFIPDADTSTEDVSVTQPLTAPEFRKGWYRDSEITYQVVDNIAVFEGDIVLGNPEDLTVAPVSKEKRRFSYGVPGAEYRWPNGTLPYAVDPQVPMQSRITNAVAHWNTVLAGVVRLVPHTNEKNYVYFTRGSGCSSNVGMTALGKQNIYLADSCSTANTIHEIGHAFGLWHEHTRMDRDNYVQVVWENILAGYAYNFYQEYNGSNLTAYDFNSIMHYPAWAFSANGQATIRTIPAGIPIGQTTTLSAGDIAGIQALYGSTTAPPANVPVTIDSNPSGLSLAIDGATVVAPYSTTWTVGSAHTVSAPDQSQTGTSARFVAWSDAGAPSHAITVPSSALSLIANYSLSYLLSLQSAGPGTLAAEPASEGNYYPAATAVSITATADSDACFAGWTGLLAGTPPSATLTMTRPYSVTASFIYGASTLARTSLLLTSRRKVTSSVSVSATSGCTWTAVSNAAWITVLSGSTYTGSNAVTFAVDVNNSGVTRSGTLTIAGETFTVRQSGR